MTWHYSNTSFATTISPGINSIVTTMTVASVLGLPVSFPYTVIIDIDQSSREVVTVTNAVSTSLTITRGVDGTTATSHSSGASVVHGVVARDLAEPQAHIDAEEDVHGVGGSAAVVGTTTSQTLTNKTMDGGANSFSNIDTSTLVGGFPASDITGTYGPIVVGVDTTHKALVTTTTGGSRTVNLMDIDGTIIIGDDYALSTSAGISADVARAPADADLPSRIFAKSSTGKPALILDRPNANADNIQEWRANGTAIAVLDKDAKLSSRAHTVNQIAADTSTHLLSLKNSSTTEIAFIDYLGNATFAGDVTLGAFNTTGAWTTYTPTWTAVSVNPAIGNGTISGRYTRWGKHVTTTVVITMGSTTTFGTGTYIFGLPVTAQSSTPLSGTGRILDSSTTGLFPLLIVGDTTSTVIGVASSALVSPTVPMTFATGDQIIYTLTYEAA